MPGGQHEPVAVAPDRLVRVEAQEALPHRVHHRGQGHRGAGVAGVGRLHGIHAQGADGVDGDLLDRLLGESGKVMGRGVGHRTTIVPRGSPRQDQPWRCPTPVTAISPRRGRDERVRQEVDASPDQRLYRGSMTGWTPPAFPAQWTWTAQLPPWVGRRAELARLEDIWAGVEHGVRQLVLMAGEPGAGKSRLVMEAAWALHTRGVPVLVGACTSDFGLPFDPLVAPVRALLAAVDRGELALAAPKARRRQGPEPLSVLTSGASSEVTAETFTAVALGAVVSALTSACAHGPLVVVLEDLRWAGKSGCAACGTSSSARPTCPCCSSPRTATHLPTRRTSSPPDRRVDAPARCPSPRPRRLRHERGVVVPHRPGRRRSGHHPFRSREASGHDRWKPFPAR